MQTDIDTFVVNVQFGDIIEDNLNEVLRDGRVCSFLIYNQLPIWYPDFEIAHHADANFLMKKDLDDVSLYNSRMFTDNGLNFAMSKMIGSNRPGLDPIVYRKFINHYNLQYILTDIVDFPEVRVKFISADKLITMYPNAIIPEFDREVLFGV